MLSIKHFINKKRVEKPKFDKDILDRPVGTYLGIFLGFPKRISIHCTLTATSMDLQNLALWTLFLFYIKWWTISNLKFVINLILSIKHFINKKRVEKPKFNKHILDHPRGTYPQEQETSRRLQLSLDVSAPGKRKMIQ